LIGEPPNEYCFAWDKIESYDIIGEKIFITCEENYVLTLDSLGYMAFCLNSKTAYIPEKISNSDTFVFNEIIILYDIDETGLNASLELSEKYHVKRILLPQELKAAGGKNIPDYVKMEFPLQELKDVLDGQKQSFGLNWKF
jgi:hypothetical protein